MGGVLVDSLVHPLWKYDLTDSKGIKLLLIVTVPTAAKK